MIAEDSDVARRASGAVAALGVVRALFSAERFKFLAGKWPGRLSRPGTQSMPGRAGPSGTGPLARRRGAGGAAARQPQPAEAHWARAAAGGG